MIVRRITREWIRTALWFRFRKIQMEFHTPPPLNGPAVLAGNHQNAILDSMTLATWPPRVPFTLSRASLFDSSLGRGFLREIRMVPVFRFRDGFQRMRRNPEAFDRFADILRKDGWLLMFPEGSHVIRYTLRPFQKGLARIVLHAQEAQGWNREIPVFPVGLQYESHRTFGGRLLIRFGPPISSLAFRDLHARDSKEAERALTAALHKEMTSLIHILPSSGEAYRKARELLVRNRGRFPDLMDQFESDRALLAQGAIPPGKKRKWWRVATGYLLALSGLILHLPVILGTLALERAYVRDPQLVPAARFVMGMFLTPAWYLVAAGLLTLLTRSLMAGVGLLVLMPASLWTWSRTWHWTR